MHGSELDSLVLLEAAVTLALDGGVMNQDAGAAIARRLGSAANGLERPWEVPRV